MTGFSVKPLSETTWPDFARLVERHNGVWGGCWCMSSTEQLKNQRYLSGAGRLVIKDAIMMAAALFTAAASARVWPAERKAKQQKHVSI